MIGYRKNNCKKEKQYLSLTRGDINGEKKMSEVINSSMLKKLKDFLIGRKSGEITPAEAEKIQKAYYTLIHTETKKKFSPTYLSLVNGLDSEEKQLFEASVYYLVRIAENKPKYKPEITEILNNKLSNKKLNPEYREYIKQQIKNIL